MSKTVATIRRAKKKVTARSPKGVAKAAEKEARPSARGTNSQEARTMEEDEWDPTVDVEKDIWAPMPPKREVTIKVRLIYEGRGKPLPLPDELLYLAEQAG